MMQKRYVLCGLLFIAGQPLANAFPVLDSVVPNGWKQVATASGDLNKDGTDDDVVVLEQLDPANLKANDGPGVPVLNLNPRRLLVMFKTAEGYQQVLGRDDLLPSEHDADSPCLADPLLEQGGVAISDGKLIIKLGSWLSCGSYAVTSSKFTFRLEGGRFRLIGYDYQEFSRNSGEISEKSINYLNGKKKTITGKNEFTESKPVTSWAKIPSLPKFYLDDIRLSCYSSGEAACGWDK